MNKNIENSLILKILGSGCCVPRKERSSSAYLVKFGGKKFLMDCGAGTLVQLVKNRENYKDIDGVILSHFHPDHTADFIPLIQALDYTPGFLRKKPLYIYGAKGIHDFITGLYNAYRLHPKNFKTNIIELEKQEEIAENLFIDTIKGNHSDNSIVIKIFYQNASGKNRGFVYSGDTDYDEKLPEFAKNINLLLLECSFPYKVEGHLTPEEAGRLAQFSSPDRLLLTHFYPPCDDPDINIRHRVKEYFIGQVMLAQDFMELVI
jgi:ribonuclease BN (tRNA processing enzyme)